MKLRLSHSLFAVVSLTFVAGLVAQEYAVKLSRPSKVGLKRHVTARCTELEEHTFVVPGKTNHTENAYELDFAAEAEDLEVDAKGHVTKASFTLENCLKTSKQGREQLFPKGTVVVAASREGKTVLSTQDGQPIPPAADKVLSAAISVHNGGPDDDEVLGTAARQSIGSSWPANADLALRDAEKKMPGMTMSAGKGVTRLVGITKVNGVDCLEFSAELQMRATPANPPAGMKILQSDLSARLAGAFPVDPSRQPLTETMEMTMKIVMSGKVGPQHVDGVARMSAYRKAELKFSYPAE